MNLRHIADTLRAISIRGCGAGLAVVGTVAGLAVAPQSVEAAQSGVATISVVVVPGSLTAGAVDTTPRICSGDSDGVASFGKPIEQPELLGRDRLQFGLERHTGAAAVRQHDAVGGNRSTTERQRIGSV